MNILLLSPGYPADMPEFTRGLAEAGARVFGVGDSPVDGLPPMVRRSLTEYIPVRSLWDEDAVIASLRERLRGQQLDRIECLWEPGILLAARLRETFGVPGLNVEQAQRFRDKELMKQALDAAGIRTPASGTAGACVIGFSPLELPIKIAGDIDGGNADNDYNNY